MNEIAEGQFTHVSQKKKKKQNYLDTLSSLLQELLFFRYDLFFLALLLCNARMVSEVPL